MSGSEPGGMAPKGSKAVVLPKFDMHIYTFEMTLEELKTTINEYCIPMDLHPRLPPPGMTMDRLSCRYIGLYVEQLDQGGLRVPFSSFFLAVIKHFGEGMSGSEPGGMAPEGSKAVVLPKFDMHIYTSEMTLEELKTTINEYCIPIDLHPRLLPSGMTMDRLSCRYIGLGRAKKCFKEVTTSLMGWKRNFFLLDRRAVPDAMPWRHGDTNLYDNFPNNYDEDEKPDAKIAAAREKKEHQNLVKAKAKRAGAGGGEVGKKHAAAAAPEIAKDILRAMKVIIDLSGNTYASTPPVEVNQPSPPREHDDTHAYHNIDVHSQSSHHDHEDESVANRCVPDWELRNDLHVCTFRSCKELVSHLATLAEDEFLGSLSNVEVISHLQNCNDAQLEELDRLRFDLRRMSQENEGLNQRLTLLDSAHSECLPREKELLDRVKDLEWERNEWRNTALDQVEKIRSLEKDLKSRTQQLVAAKEKVGVLEGKKLDLLGKVARAEADHKKLVHEFLPTVVKRLHTSVEYRKSLAALIQLCYTTGWLGGLSLDLIQERRETVAIREAIYKKKVEQYYNKRIWHVSFKVGDFVYRRNEASRVENQGKLGPNWEGLYRVIEAYDNGSYKLCNMNDREVSRTWHAINLENCFM
nr:reverse transcriptase domain-containing protein [Tanacetum cinerariifolium]